MSRFGMTGKVLAKVDRAVDPYQHIDRVREEVFEHLQRLEGLEREVQALKNTNATRWTESGVWKVVKAKLDEEAIDWMKWGIRAALAGLGSAMLAVIGFVFELTWKALHT